MSVLILIIILGVLIFIHELGHFLIAKKNGIRVDEFAIGFPPTLWSKTKDGTKYCLNLIPLGGYVKIFGETVTDEALDKDAPDSFLNKSAWVQAAVLIGGVLFNIIFAWLLISISLMSGFPSVVTESNRSNITESYVVVTGVRADSPAIVAGLEPGDQITSIIRGDMNVPVEDVTVARIQEVISENTTEVLLKVNRANEQLTIAVTPELGVIDDEKPMIGISLDRIGKLQLPFFSAIGRGFMMTGQMMKDIAVGLGGLIADAVTGQGSLDNVAGPVGIVGLVDNASNFGFAYLLSFTAFISINLAILNILPLPALDGGRLLILLIEGIIRRRIKPTVVNAINGIGFLVLILLMIVITINDVFRLL